MSDGFFGAHTYTYDNPNQTTPHTQPELTQEEKMISEVKKQVSVLKNYAENIIYGNIDENDKQKKKIPLYNAEPITTENIFKAWKMLGERLQTEYTKLKNETDENEKKKIKLFLKMMLKNLNGTSRYPDERLNTIMKCPTTFVLDSTACELFKNRDECFKSKYESWYIPKGEFDKFAKDIELDKDVKEIFEYQREGHRIWEFSQTSLGRFGTKTLNKVLGESALAKDPDSLSTTTHTVLHGGKKRRKTKRTIKHRKSNRRKSSHR